MVLAGGGRGARGDHDGDVAVAERHRGQSLRELREGLLADGAAVRQLRHRFEPLLTPWHYAVTLALCLVHVLIGCSLMLALRWCLRFLGPIQAPLPDVRQDLLPRLLEQQGLS